MKVKVCPENYVVIQGWMVTQLGLKGAELLIYAVIYGFSQDRQWFSGSLQYLMEWTNCSKPGVLKCIKSLLDKGLIEKAALARNGVRVVEYRAVENLLKTCGQVVEN